MYFSVQYTVNQYPAQGSIYIAFNSALVKLRKRPLKKDDLV